MGQAIFWNIFLVTFVWIMANLIGAKYVKSMPHDHFTIGYADIGLKKGHLSCQCGKSENTIEKDLDLKTAHKFFRDITRDKEFIDNMHTFEEVKEFIDCYHCNLSYINCAENFCMKKVLRFVSKRDGTQKEPTVSTAFTVMPSNDGNQENVSIGETTLVANETEKNADEIITGSTILENVTNLNETKDHVNNSKIDDKILVGHPPPVTNIPHVNNSNTYDKVPASNVTPAINIPSVNKSQTVSEIPAGFVPPVVNIPNKPPIMENATNLNETKDHVNSSNTDDEIPAGYVPPVINIPIGGHTNHSRPRRFVGCSYPTAMETAAISCRVYPSSIKCVQRCAFGYTLDSGIRKEMKCSFKENRWVPSGFKECLPFVDCSVTLSSGGSATCSTSSVDQAPVCKIECLRYEDKSEVPTSLYTCKIDGTWDPKLPFCVIPGSGMVLTSPPRGKVQAD